VRHLLLLIFLRWLFARDLSHTDVKDRCFYADPQTHTHTDRQEKQTDRPCYICSNSLHLCTVCTWCDRQTDRHADVWRTTLCQPFTTTTFGKRAFRCSAPAVWNSLPKTVLSSDSVAVFKSRLKTFLFSQAFSSFSAHQHAAWPQRLWSYDLMALYKSVYHYYYCDVPSSWQLVPLLTNKDVSLIMRGRLNSSCVESSMLHGSETWPVRKENVVALQRAEMRMVRWVGGVKLTDTFSK